MTQIKVDTIADAAGTGATDFADGITIAGGALSALNTAEYYSSASEPTSPKNGAIWWDTTNEKVMVYIADEFKEVELGGSAGPVSWTVSDISSATYDSVSFDTTAQDGNMNSLFFSTDGTKMFAAGHSTDTVYEYSLSTGFDISTASYNSVSLSISGQDTFPKGLSFSSDGTKMYVSGSTNNNVHQYTLTSAWDLSTASYDSVSYSPHAVLASVDFNNDGTKMYTTFVGSPASIRQHTLSTAWDLSTASYDSVSFSTSSQETQPWGVCFNPEGTQMFVTGYSSDRVHQYTLSTAFDLSTASYDSLSLDVVLQENRPTSIRFNADGSKMFVLGYTNDDVFQYSTGL